MKSFKRRFNKKQFTKKQKKPMAKNVKKKFSKYAKKKFSKKHNRRKTVYLKKRGGGVPNSLRGRVPNSLRGRALVSPLPPRQDLILVGEKERAASLMAAAASEARAVEWAAEWKAARGVMSGHQSQMLKFMHDTNPPSYNMAILEEELPEFRILSHEAKNNIKTLYYNNFSRRDREMLTPVDMVDGAFSHTYHPTTHDDIIFLKIVHDHIINKIYDLNETQQDVTFSSNRKRLDYLKHVIINYRPSVDGHQAYFVPHPSRRVGSSS
tara:strand:+ start:3626 stop:4423 length:798 start_codon:yes stop_codon:yes gene_type:complete